MPEGRNEAIVLLRTTAEALHSLKESAAKKVSASWKDGNSARKAARKRLVSELIGSSASRQGGTTQEFRYAQRR